VAWSRRFASVPHPTASASRTPPTDAAPRSSRSRTAQLREAWADDDVTDLLDQITTPTLVTHALNDQVVPFDEARRLAAGIPSARLLPLDSRNHALLPTEAAWRTFIDEVRAFLGAAPSAVTPHTPLSGRELGVVQLVAAGLTNQQFATRLGLSTRTVERHLSNSYAKLDVTGRSARAAAAAYVSRLGD
jgi:DNA-binding CsgD family transcriptional regulator